MEVYFKILHLQCNVKAAFNKIKFIIKKPSLDLEESEPEDHYGISPISSISGHFTLN